MKIALVSPYDLLHPGGVNTHVVHLARGLRARGADARILAPVARGHAVPSHVIPLPGRLATVTSAGARARVSLDPRAVRAARAVLARERFDVVHLHNPLSPLVCLGVLAGRARLPGSAFVATFHEYRDRVEPVMELAKRLCRRFIDALDARIAVSPVAAAFNRRRFPGEYTIVPNGVDVARFASDARADRDPRPTILFVGRVEARKGLPWLLEAFARVARGRPDARLVVVGPGDRAAAPRLPGVELIGTVTDAALPGFYRDADVFCAPSVDYESFGIVLLEAMAAGVPIVASDLAAFRGVVTHGRQGLLVPPRDPAALAAALDALLADPARRRTMAAAGRLTAAAFDWPLVTAQVLGVYDRLLAARGRQYPVASSLTPSRPM